MKKIERHAFKTDAQSPLFERQTKRIRDLLTRAPMPTVGQLHQFGLFGLHFIEVASALNREHVLLRPAARMLGQGMLAGVQLGGAEAHLPVEVVLNDQRATLETAGPDGQSGVSAWREGYYGALMARDSATLEALRRVSNSHLRVSSNVDAYHFAWKDALVAADSQPSQALEHIARALALTDEATIAAPGVPSHAATVFPILRGIVENDSARFNDALAAALEAHKARASKTPHGPDGWIALGPLALTCLAHDRGLPLEVESDYLLPALIQGS